MLAFLLKCQNSTYTIQVGIIIIIIKPFNEQLHPVELATN